MRWPDVTAVEIVWMDTITRTMSVTAYYTIKWTGLRNNGRTFFTIKWITTTTFTTATTFS
jgi:hypothetical protein